MLKLNFSNGILCLSLMFLFYTSSAQDSTEFKPSGKLWGYAFGDFAYKAQGDTVGGNGRGGSNQYSNVKNESSLFQLRRVYLGYNYDISKKFSAEFLLAAEDDFANGDLLGNGKLAPYVKLANIRWKNIFPGTDLIFGLQPTSAFATTSEPVWGYRSIERTILDVRRTSSYDLGLGLRGHLPNNDNFGYSLLVSDGTGAKPEGDAFKWFSGDIYAKFLNKRLTFDFYADYNRMNLVEGWHHEKSTFKLFAAYSAPKFTVGAEAFIVDLKGDDIATEVATNKKDTLDTKASGISVFVRGKLYKEKLGFFARFDSYNPGGNIDNSKYNAYSPLTAQYNPNTKEQFFTAGVDFTPVKNVHIMPNIWYNAYYNDGPKNYGSNNDSHDVVYRLTFYYTYGK